MEYLSPAPLDDSLYIATGRILWVYDQFFCARQLSPAAHCPAPFVSLDYVRGVPGTLLAATALNIFELPAPDPASPSCGSPLLPASPLRAITAVRGAPSSGVFFTEGGSVWVTPPLSSAARPLAPRLLLGNSVGGDRITGVRSGLALWGERYLYYGAAGESAWPGDDSPRTFRGVLRAGQDGAAPSVFFHYASSGDVLHWTPQRLAAAGGDVAWSELRAAPGKPPPVFAVQRTLLGGNAPVTVATSYLCEAPVGGEGASLAGDDGGGGVVWTACGRGVAAFAAGPARAPPLAQLSFAAEPPGTPAGDAPPVTAFAFAPGATYCGHRFSYAQPADSALVCGPRPRVWPHAGCALSDPAAAARALPPWGVALVAVGALLALLCCGWALWRAGGCLCGAARAAGRTCRALCAAAVRPPPRTEDGKTLVEGWERAWEANDATDDADDGALEMVAVAERKAVAPPRLISNRGRGRKLSGSVL